MESLITDRMLADVANERRMLIKERDTILDTTDGDVSIYDGRIELLTVEIAEYLRQPEQLSLF